MIVRTRVIDVLIRFFSNRQWWDHVIVNPDDSKIIVFSSGTLRGLMVLIPVGVKNSQFLLRVKACYGKMLKKRQGKNRFL